MKQHKVGFVFATPNSSSFPNFLTLPYLFNIVKLLDNAGVKVDLFIKENHTESSSGYFSQNVKVHFLNYSFLNRFPAKIKYFFILLHFRIKNLFLLNKKYDLVFGSGSMGTVLGQIISSAGNTPFIYVNDEFPDSRPIEFWKILEKKSAEKATIVVVPDETRILPLLKQIPEIGELPFSVLPNAPLISPLESLPEIDWHKRFNIPSGKKIFLMAGTIHSAAQTTEIICTIPLWPEEAVLVLKVKSGDKNIVREYNHLKHLNVKDRIFWVTEFLTNTEINAFHKYCTASFGLYREVDDNLTFIGKSSGKIMTSLAFGVPVIGNKGHGMDFIEKEKMGVLVNHPLEIPEAIKYILANERELNESCLRNYYSISFENYWEKFIQKILTYTGIKFEIVGRRAVQNISPIGTKLKKPNFFIVGAPRCGTTAMFYYLGGHPDIFIPPIKEAYYFGKSELNELYPHLRKGTGLIKTEEEYLALFSKAGSEKCIGEATPTYLMAQSSAEEIYKFNPEAKIIIMLRNPTELLISLHRLGLRTGTEVIPDFKEALSSTFQARIRFSHPSNQLLRNDLFYSNVTKLTEQVAKYIKVFGREKIHIIVYDDFVNNLEKVYRETLEFLQVDAKFRPEVFNKINANTKTRISFIEKLINSPPKSLKNAARIILPKKVRIILIYKILDLNQKKINFLPVEASFINKLKIEFNSEVESLGKLIGRDLSHWSIPKK